MTTALPYASDFSGIVCGFRFAPDAPGVPIDSAGALEWLAQSSAERASTDSSSDFVWLHFDLANSASERWMRTQLDLPDAFFENLRDGSHSTRIEHQDGALLAVINDVMFNFDVTPSEIATLWVYTRETLLITARLKPLRSIDTLRESVRNGEVFRSTAELLIHLLRDQADLLVQIVRRTSIDIDGDRRPVSFDALPRHPLGTRCVATRAGQVAAFARA
jgi:zinc transporter